MNQKIVNNAILSNNFYLIGISGHIIAYIFMLLGLTELMPLKSADSVGSLFSILSLLVLVGLIIAYINRTKAEPWLQIYFQYMIRTFWITLLYNVSANLISLTILPADTFANLEAIKSIDIGNAGVMLVLCLLVSIFFIMRTLKARRYLALQQSIPNLTTWKI